MTTFLALYRGATVGDAKMVAVSADPRLVAYVATELLSAPASGDESDPVLDELEEGRRRALQLIAEWEEER